MSILMADDDADDREMAADALKESGLNSEMYFVQDGVELLDYLHKRGKFAPPAIAPRPGLILLDLNMPNKDGREVLREIKRDPNLHRIPVVVLTTSKAEEDILRSYDLGANSFIRKPVAFTELVQLMKMLGTYWLEIVELPQ